MPASERGCARTGQLTASPASRTARLIPPANIGSDQGQHRNVRLEGELSRQEKKETLIHDFRGPAYFLSNFYRHPVHIGDDVYPTTEHAYQAGSRIRHPADRKAARSENQSRRLLGRHAIARDGTSARSKIQRLNMLGIALMELRDTLR